MCEVIFLTSMSISGQNFCTENTKFSPDISTRIRSLNLDDFSTTLFGKWHQIEFQRTPISDQNPIYKQTEKLHFHTDTLTKNRRQNLDDFRSNYGR